ncbi:MAG: hypothetical protein NXI24_15855 [bacterium]|nr:hypothetical protein [bacterium]
MAANDEVSQEPRSDPADTGARRVDIVQGGATRVQGDHVSIKQGGTVIVDARQLELFQGAVVYARGDSLKMTASQAGVAFARGSADIEQGATGAVIAAGPVNLDKSAAGAIIAREVRAERSASVFLIAKNVSGQVKTLFGTRESLLFALVAGLAGGIAFAITRLLLASRRSQDD